MLTIPKEFVIDAAETFKLKITIRPDGDIIGPEKHLDLLRDLWEYVQEEDDGD